MAALHVERHPFAETASPVVVDTLPQGSVFVFQDIVYFKGPPNAQGRFLCPMFAGNNPGGSAEFTGEQVIPCPDYYLTTGR